MAKVRRPLYSSSVVPAVVHENTLYFLSNAEELVAVDLERGTPAARRVRWKTLIQKKFQRLKVHSSRLYIGTESGEILIVDANSGNVLVTQKIGMSAASIYVTDESFFILEAGGVKEYGVERNANQGITNKEALTELAGAVLSKGEIDEAAKFAERVAREADPNYPPLRLLQARLAQARRNTAATRRALVTYVDLIGRQSRAGQDVLAELKRDHGLLWQTTMGKAVAGSPWVVEGRLISNGRVRGADAQVVALDPANGRVLWRQNAERVLDVVYDPESHRQFYVRGQNSDPKVVQVYVMRPDNGERKEFARLTLPSVVNLALIAFANDRLFVAATSLDLSSAKLSIRISCFNATSGKKLWDRPHDLSANYQEAIIPLGVFGPKGDFLVYSVGRDFWVIRGDDGAIHASHQEDSIITDQWTRRDNPDLPDMAYFATNGNQVVGYSLSAKQVVFRTTLPDIDPQVSACACDVRGHTAFDIDGRSAYAFDVGHEPGASNRLKWQVNAGPDRKFKLPFLYGEYFWVYRDDLILLQIDPSTGKILNEYPLLWAPSGISLDADRLYAFTSDGLAYAMQLKPSGK